jgi:hypothetical protein
MLNAEFIEGLKIIAENGSASSNVAIVGGISRIHL